MGKVIPMLGGGGTDLDMITATASDVRAGKVIVDKEGNPVTGTEPERGNWTGNVAMNGKITIPDGHHGGGGYVNGPAVTQRGAWNGSVGMNTQVAIPEGYHNGAGKVSGPSVAYQNADVSGTDRAYTTGISTWGGVICLGVRNGHYLNGVNWIQADIPGLQAANIKEGISIGNLKGTMKDYSYLAVNQVPFDGASFSGVMAGGAEKCIAPDNNNIQRDPLTITENGIQMTTSKVYNVYPHFCPKKSIDFSPFREVRVTGKFTGISRGKGGMSTEIWRTDVDKILMLRNQAMGSLAYKTVGLDYSKTEYACVVDVSGISGQAFLTVRFSNLQNLEWPSYFITRIEFLT